MSDKYLAFCAYPNHPRWQNSICPMKGLCVCLSWATRGLHTWVCNTFPCGADVLCLLKYPHGTHMKPMHVGHLYCPCLVHVRLPIVGPMWAATNEAHWSLQQFTMWGLRVLPLETPSSQVIKRSAQPECNCKASPWRSSSREGQHFCSLMYQAWYKGRVPEMTHPNLEKTERLGLITGDNRITPCSTNSHGDL